MILFTPKKSKFTKQQKGRAFNKINKDLSLNPLKYGCIGLKALEAGRISSTQLLALRQTLNKHIKKKGRIFLNIFPHTPITNKPIKVRMGKGKGSVDHYVAKIQPGLLLCEIETASINLAKKALILVQNKLPLKTKLIFEANIIS